MQIGKRSPFLWADVGADFTPPAIFVQHVISQILHSGLEPRPKPCCPVVTISLFCPHPVLSLPTHSPHNSGTTLKLPRSLHSLVNPSTDYYRYWDEIPIPEHGLQGSGWSGSSFPLHPHWHHFPLITFSRTVLFWFLQHAVFRRPRDCLESSFLTETLLFLEVSV